MTKFNAGDDVVVDFAGIEHQGEVIEQRRSGYVMVRIILADPSWVYGSIGARLDPEPTVCVKLTNVRHKS
jgi:hypothetical protein